MPDKKFSHKALDQADDVGAVIAALVGIAGIFHVPERLEISADELAMFIGFAFTIVAFVRGRFEGRRRSNAADDHG